MIACITSDQESAAAAQEAEIASEVSCVDVDAYKTYDALKQNMLSVMEAAKPISETTDPDVSGLTIRQHSAKYRVKIQFSYRENSP